MIAYAPTPALVVDLVALIGADTTLHREARDEYSGQCPKCIGHDRFHVSLKYGWMCRRCHPKWSDAAGYLMWRDGIRYPEALKALGGMELMPAPPPAQTEPTVEDRAAFALIADYCHISFSDPPTDFTAIEWLANRGITMPDIVLWQLGICAGRPGRKSWIAGRNVWCGLTIPLWGVDGQLYGIQVRRSRQPEPWDTNRDWRYAQVWGSHMPLYGQPPKHSTTLLVEGCFDAILLHRIAGDLVDVAAVGSDRHDVADRWYSYLNRHTRWLIGHDADKAGELAAASWLGKPRSTRAVLPHVVSGGYVAKDPTEVWQALAAEQGATAADGALRGWVRSMLG